MEQRVYSLKGDTRAVIPRLSRKILILTWDLSVWHIRLSKFLRPKQGAGISDLQGIISKLDYLKRLRVIIWLSQSIKFVDQSYDISDYYAMR